MNHIIKVTTLLLGLLFLASAAAAQKVEITPFIGYQFGGWFTDDFADGYSLDEVQDSETFGLILDFSINRHAQIEVLYEAQDTEFDRLSFRGPSPVRDLDIEYFQVGFLWQWLPTEEIRPFIVGSLGAANLDLEGGVDETRFATTVGGGVKFFFSDHVGARFEGRLYHVLLENNDEVFCNPDACFGYQDTNVMIQFELKAGFVLAF